MTATRSGRERVCTAVALAVVVLLLASVARLYHPPYGFTEMIGFASPGTGELPVLQALPHYRHPPWGSYDGQFYAQLALEPLPPGVTLSERANASSDVVLLFTRTLADLRRRLRSRH